VRVVLALDRLQETTSERGALLARYAAAIQTQRGDYNGRVLSLRDADLQTLSTIYGASLAEVTEQLLECGVLSQGPDGLSSGGAASRLCRPAGAGG
jgi:hypothetical protein